ncbi:MAG: damage-inducible protein DinB [SAR86 cluster bacterium]|uniref:Damage-inducible protein DinB n=1 Tax=SAR86 cluster bacterium TaxID=2030880 RepID=A0A2A4XJ92_9GAMM|nr:MAG: damage-inducible protein DinB [SAR86 cluster bacterium]
MQKENFQLFAQYNQWMNEKLVDAAAQLSEKDLTQDRGTFFGSVLGTLNHLIVGDIVWLKRFATDPEKFRSLDSLRETAMPESLGAQLYDDLESLHSARQKLDAAIISFCDEVCDEQLVEKLDYQNFQGNNYRDQLGLLLLHLFNHQTHHRGQITTLLSQASIDVGPTDLLVCIRET